MDEVVFFAAPAEFRAWLTQHHATAAEFWVGFHKKESGLPSISWPEAVDEALCVGWIDGLRKSIDVERYRIRFTPRKPRSLWSAVNIGRVADLSAQGRMQPAGLAAFAQRSEGRSGIYSYEQQNDLTLSAADEVRFRANPAAWAFFEAQPPSYRHSALHWVLGAKQETTRQKRFSTLIDDSVKGLRIAPLRRGTSSAFRRHSSNSNGRAPESSEHVGWLDPGQRAALGTACCEEPGVRL